MKYNVTNRLFSRLKELTLVVAVAGFALSSAGTAEAAVLDLSHPTESLVPESGPFGFGGRGVIFQALEDFTMSSFSMEGRWSGSLDLGVDVFSVPYAGGRNLISSSTYSAQTWTGSSFTTLAHTQSFTAGGVYEVVFRFADPGMIFPHYNFNNSTNLASYGYTVGSVLRVLDGSDFDQAKNRNYWLANFRMNTADAVSPVPVPASLPLLGGALGMIGLFSSRRRRRKA